MFPILIIIFIIFFSEFNKSKTKFLIALFLPVIFLISFESYLYHANNTKERETTAGVMLLGKTPLIGLNKPQNSKYPKLSNIIYERGKKVRRIVNSSDDFHIRQYLRKPLDASYHDLGNLYKPIAKKISEYKKIYGTRDSVTKGVFKEYLIANLVEAIKLISLNFIGLWQLSEILTTEGVDKYMSWRINNKIDDKYHKEKLDNFFNVIKSHAKFAKITMTIILLATVYLFIYGVLKNFKSFKNSKKNNSYRFLFIHLTSYVKWLFLINCYYD